MVLPDVTILVRAFRTDSSRHADHLRRLEGVVAGDQAYAMSGLVVSGFLRVVTHPRVFRNPDPLDRALAFARHVVDQPHCLRVAPGPRHWDIFTGLCRAAGAKGNLIADAYLAALAIEHGCEWITTDRDYARFPGLTWRPALGE